MPDNFPRIPATLDPRQAKYDAVLGEAELALRGGLYDRAIEFTQAILARSEDPALRCEALRVASNTHRLRCDWVAALDAARQELREAEAAGLHDRLAEALNAEAAVYLARNDHAAARPLLRQALALTTAPRVLGVLWQNIGLAEGELGNFNDADAAFSTSAQYFDRAGDLWGMACTLVNQGCLQIDRGDDMGAEEILGRAITSARAVNDLDLVSSAMMNRARALFRLQRFDDAEFDASSAAGFFVSSGMTLRYAECLLTLGEIELARGDAGIAKRCWTRAIENVAPLGPSGLAQQLRQRLEALEATLSG